MPFEGKLFLNVPSVPSSPFWLLDPVEEKWTAVTASPHPGAISYASVTSLGSNSVMLLGGLLNLISPSGIWILQGQTWTNSSVQLNGALYAHTTVLINNTAYIFGGGNAETGVVFNTLYSLQVQNGSVVGPLQNIASTSSNWPVARFDHTAVVVTMNNSEVMAVYGGAQQDIYLGDLWVYNPKKSLWTELYNVACGAALAGQPPQLYNHAAVALSPRKMAIIGGMNCNSVNENAVYVYDFSIGNWSQLHTIGLAAVESMSVGWVAETSTMLLFGGGQPLLQMQPACASPLVATSSFANSECIPCHIGTYYASWNCTPCPSGLSTRQIGATSVSDCNICESSYCSHGSCSVDSSGPNCRCDLGYEGRHCEVRI